MVYIQSWQEYQDAAEALYAKSPVNVRRTYSLDVGSCTDDLIFSDAVQREMEGIRRKARTENNGQYERAYAELSSP